MMVLMVRFVEVAVLLLLMPLSLSATKQSATFYFLQIPHYHDSKMPRFCTLFA